MTILERDLDTCDLSEFLESFVELFVSPILPETFHEQACFGVKLATLSVVGQSSAYFTVDLWEANLLDQFASYTSLNGITSYPYRRQRICRMRSRSSGRQVYSDQRTTKVLPLQYQLKVPTHFLLKVLIKLDQAGVSWQVSNKDSRWTALDL